MMLNQRHWRWYNVDSTLCAQRDKLGQNKTLNQCCFNVGPTLKHHWPKVMCLLGSSYSPCFWFPHLGGWRCPHAATSWWGRADQRHYTWEAHSHPPEESGRCWSKRPGSEVGLKQHQHILTVAWLILCMGPRVRIEYSGKCKYSLNPACYRGFKVKRYCTQFAEKNIRPK